MTREETTLLTRYVKACCPQQAIDRYTPDAWHDLLGEYDLAECRAAAIRVASSQPFVAPSEIIAAIRQERRAALGRARRAKLDAEIPQVAIMPRRGNTGRGPSDPRPLREQIEAIFAEHNQVTGAQP